VRLTQTTQAIAFLLSEYGVYDGDASLWKNDFEALLDMDRESVREAAAVAFTEDRLSVVTVEPTSHGAGPAEPA
jgi:hypothetical protein